MDSSLLYWCEIYERFKSEALCLDIETTYYNGPISLVGWYKPQEGLIQ